MIIEIRVNTMQMHDSVGVEGMQLCATMEIGALSHLPTQIVFGDAVFDVDDVVYRGGGDGMYLVCYKDLSHGSVWGYEKGEYDHDSVRQFVSLIRILKAEGFRVVVNADDDDSEYLNQHFEEENDA